VGVDAHTVTNRSLRSISSITRWRGSMASTFGRQFLMDSAQTFQVLVLAQHLGLKPVQTRLQRCHAHRSSLEPTNRRVWSCDRGGVSWVSKRGRNYVKRKDTYIALFQRSFERGQKFFLFLSAPTLREHGRNPNSEFVRCRQPECLSSSHTCARGPISTSSQLDEKPLQRRNQLTTEAKGNYFIFSGLNQLITEAKGNYFIACRI
jgi:hypothetical protein